MEPAPATRRRHLPPCLALLLLIAASAFCQNVPHATPPSNAAHGLRLSRPVRPWEFLDAVGMKAGLFGDERGTFEAWVYPLKILRNFHLVFHVANRTIPAESLARTVEVRPESCTIVFSDDAFSVRETWFVPVRENGAIITIEVNSYQPVQVEARFQPDFQLMWPAGLGGTFGSWDDARRAFVFGEEQKQFFALAGSTDAIVTGEQFSNNYASSSLDSFDLGEPVKGNATRTIVIAGSVHGRQEAEATYQRLLSGDSAMRSESAAYYQQYLDRTVSLALPDAQIQQAYDWSRVSAIQGLVENPFLGTGLVAGYRTAADTTRPGFAWFFGRDSLWTTLALDSAGDFKTARTALEFLSKYQRADGKVPHEIAQTASLVPWFDKFPYPWASADATPLFIITANDYVTASGDLGFLREKWDNLWRAYQFLRSTYGPEGFAQNHGIGHGWVEGGPLLPVKAEFYQAGLGVAALHALANLARLDGKSDIARDLEQQYTRQKTQLNQAFWSADKGLYAFALDEQGRRVDTASVLATVPMWFALSDAGKADQMITRLAAPDHATDWGMRIISSDNPVYDPSGYHFGSVWPLFTGWASVGEYAYHRANPAFANLSSNALLALNGAPGRVTEVLSGSYFEPVLSSSPHQIWSSAMVMNSILRGLLGLSGDAIAKKLTFAPHIPADWDHSSVTNLRVGSAVLELSYQRSANEITFQVGNSGAAIEVTLSPAVSPHAEVLGVDVDGRRADFHLESNASDQHVTLHFSAPAGVTNVRIHLRGDFGISVPAPLPPLGASSQNLKVMSETWSANRDTLVLDVAGLAGREYDLVLSGDAPVTSVAGAQLVQGSDGRRRLRVRFAGPEKSTYEHGSVTLHFPARSHPTVTARTWDKLQQPLQPAFSQTMTRVP